MAIEPFRLEIAAQIGASHLKCHQRTGHGHLAYVLTWRTLNNHHIAGIQMQIGRVEIIALRVFLNNTSTS